MIWDLCYCVYVDVQLYFIIDDAIIQGCFIVDYGLIRIVSVQITLNRKPFEAYSRFSGSDFFCYELGVCYTW